MPRPVSELTVRRQTGIARKKQAKAARKSLRLRGSRRPRRLSAKQKALVRKRKASGFFKKAAALRSSLDLPATVTGSISHRTEYIDLILEVASGFKDEKQSAREFAKLFIEKDPAFSNTDTGMAAILFEAHLFDKGEDVVEQFLETQLEGQDTTFLAIFEGQIKDEPLEKLSKGVKEFCTFEMLVKAGDTNHADGTVSDVTILECTPKRGAASKARQQQKEPEPSMRTEGLLPHTKADYEAIIQEGGISDNAFMYLFPNLWEAAQVSKHNGDIFSAKDIRGATWYCHEGTWLPDHNGLDEAKKYAIRTEKGAQTRVLSAIRKRDKAAKVDPEKNPITAWVTTKLSLKQIEDMDGVEDVVLASQQEDLDEAAKFKSAEEVRDHFFDKKKGYTIKIAGHTVEVVKASVSGSPPTVKWTGKKKGTGFMLDFLDAVDPNDRKFPSEESVDEAYMLTTNVKAHGKKYTKGKTVKVLKKTKQGFQVELEPGVETHLLKKEIEKFTAKAPQFEDITEAFTATFLDQTRANRFAREIRIHARTIRPKGTQVYYEAREDDHTKDSTHAEAIDELCKKHGGKKKGKKYVKEEEDTTSFVAGPFLGDAEPRLIHNGSCEVVGFPTALQDGPLYLESEEGFQSKFLAWTVKREGTDDGKVLVHVGSDMYRLPASLSEVKGLLDKMEEFYEDLPDEFDSMIEAFLEEYCTEKGTKLCHEDVVSTGLSEALSDWTSHEFIATRDTRIQARCRMRRLALGEDLDIVSTLQEADTSKAAAALEKARWSGAVKSKAKKLLGKVLTYMQKNKGKALRGVEVATAFKLKGPGSALPVQAALNALEDAGLVKGRQPDPDEPKRFVAEDLDEARLVIRTEKGKKADVLKAIRAKDKAAKVEPEGNPVTAWVTTKLSVATVRNMPGVEDAAKSVGTQGFAEETCTIEVAQVVGLREVVVGGQATHEVVAEMHLFIDGEDMGHIDDATVSAMVGGFRVGEKATTKVVKCPGCDGKVLAATGYCVVCKKKTIKAEDLDEQRGHPAAMKEQAAFVEKTGWKTDPKQKNRVVIVPKGQNKKAASTLVEMGFKRRGVRAGTTDVDFQKGKIAATIGMNDPGTGYEVTFYQFPVEDLDEAKLPKFSGKRKVKITGFGKTLAGKPGATGAITGDYTHVDLLKFIANTKKKGQDKTLKFEFLDGKKETVNVSVMESLDEFTRKLTKADIQTKIRAAEIGPDDYNLTKEDGKWVITLYKATGVTKVNRYFKNTKTLTKTGEFPAKLVLEDLDEAKKQDPTADNISNYIRNTLSGTDRETTPDLLFGVAKRSFKGLTMKQFMATWNSLVKEGYLKKVGKKYMWESTLTERDWWVVTPDSSHAKEVLPKIKPHATNVYQPPHGKTVHFEPKNAEALKKIKAIAKAGQYRVVFEDLDEARVTYMVSVHKGQKGQVLRAIREQDKTAKEHPDSPRNPLAAWVTTKLDSYQLEEIDGVERATRSHAQEDLDEAEPFWLAVPARDGKGIQLRRFDKLSDAADALKKLKLAGKPKVGQKLKGAGIVQAASLGAAMTAAKKKDFIAEENYDLDEAVTYFGPKDLALRKGELWRVQLQADSMQEIHAAAKALKALGKYKPGGWVGGVLRVSVSKSTSTPGLTAELVTIKKSVRDLEGILKKHVPGFSTSKAKIESIGTYPDDYIDEAKHGLTLEKIRMSGEYQAFKVLKGKSLVGFLMQTGKNTADEEHPWKAFRVAQGGKVGEKIGFYYKRDGGQSAALQAIAKTGLESEDDPDAVLVHIDSEGNLVEMRNAPPDLVVAVGDLQQRLQAAATTDIDEEGYSPMYRYHYVSRSEWKAAGKHAKGGKGGERRMLRYERGKGTVSVPVIVVPDGDKRIGTSVMGRDIKEDLDEDFQKIAGVKINFKPHKLAFRSVKSVKVNLQQFMRMEDTTTTVDLVDPQGEVASVRLKHKGGKLFVIDRDPDDLRRKLKKWRVVKGELNAAYKAATESEDGSTTRADDLDEAYKVVLAGYGTKRNLAYEVKDGTTRIAVAQVNPTGKRVVELNYVSKSVKDTKGADIRAALKKDGFNMDAVKESIDEALHIKRSRDIESERAFRVMVQADNKKEMSALRKALVRSPAGKAKSIVWEYTGSPTLLRFVVVGGMFRNAKQVGEWVQDTTGLDIEITEGCEIEQLEGEALDDARAGAMTAKVPGVGMVKEPTHMKALARKAGKSGKVALQLWGKAQAAANEQYPELKAAKGKGGEKERRYYKVVTAIFKNMLGLGKEESEQTDPIIAEVLCHSCRSTTEVFLYAHNVGVCGECGSVHVTPTGEMHYATEGEIEAADPKLLEVTVADPNEED